MEISNEKKIKDVQQEFSKQYPNLKIKFYKQHHDEKQGSMPIDEWDEDLSLGEIRKDQPSAEFEINEKMSVKDLESRFYDGFGLNVQVFRKSSNEVWLQTISTDDWSLSKQNNRTN